MKITTIGIDLAKDKFQLHAVNADGKVIVKKQISKRGDAYLRTLLIQGARAVAHHADKSTANNSGLLSLMGRRNKNVAIVALANKNARIVWAVLTKNSQYDANPISVPC